MSAAKPLTTAEAEELDCPCRADGELAYPGCVLVDREALLATTRERESLVVWKEHLKDALDQEERRRLASVSEFERRIKILRMALHDLVDAVAGTGP